MNFKKIIEKKSMHLVKYYPCYLKTFPRKETKHKDYRKQFIESEEFWYNSDKITYHDLAVVSENKYRKLITHTREIGKYAALRKPTCGWKMHRFMKY